MSWGDVADTLKEAARSVASVHRPDGRPNVFVFTTPRSGSTWLTELLCSQPGYKDIDEPDDIRYRHVRKHLGISDWVTLCNQSSEPLLRRYFDAFCSGKLHFMDPWPSFKRFRPVTKGIVFKLLHCGEDRISWFRDTFNGRVVLLLRHPIPVTLSREVFPRLEAFLDSDYRRHFTREQLAFAREVIDSGSRLERGVLDWTLQNAVPLKQAEPDWIILTYEQLLLDPEPCIERLASELSLPDPELMRRSVAVPSSTVRKSDRATARVLSGPESEDKKRWLLEKWRSKVNSADEARAMRILQVFDVDAYVAGSPLPTGRFAVTGLARSYAVA
jgi:hypothetical protein